MDRLTKQQRSRNMRAVRSSGSKIEVMLAKALHARGYRYRKNDRRLVGKPDIVMSRYRLVIFADSEFWHGKDWKKRKHDIKSNRAFWVKKIENNMRRDREVTAELTAAGWKVLRFWGREIEKKLEYCIDKVEQEITHT